GLRRGNPHFVGIDPPPYLLALQNVLEQRVRRGRTQPSQGLDDLHSSKTHGVIFLQQRNELGDAFGLSAHAHFIDSQRTNQRIKRIVNGDKQLRPLLGGRSGKLANSPVVR